MTEVSLAELETRPSSRKGSVDILPRIGSMARESGGKCTAYPTERRMLMAVWRAVPWFLRAKNREESRERCYLPVCSRLTLKNGDRLKRLDGHENLRRLGMRAFFLFFEKTKE